MEYAASSSGSIPTVAVTKNTLPDDSTSKIVLIAVCVRMKANGGTCKIERGSRSDSYSCSIRFRFDSRKKGFCKRLNVSTVVSERVDRRLRATVSELR